MNDTTETTRPKLEADGNARLPGKREQTKATNRGAILAAAREVFAELGYGATTVRDIIRNTGLASGTFYNYYKSKEEIFEALMDDSSRRMRPRVRAARLASNSFEEFVRNALRAYFEFLIEDDGSYAVIRRNAGALRVRMVTPETIAGFEEIRSYIEEDIAAGRLHEVDGEYLTAAAIGVATEIGERMILREEADVEAAVEFATNLLFKGLPGLPAKNK